MDGRMANSRQPLQTTQQHQEIGTSKSEKLLFSKAPGGYPKEVWHFTIAGSADKDTIKWTLNDKNWQITINQNCFPEINYYYAGWLSGADPEVLQLSNVGSAINQSMNAIDPASIKVNEDKSGWM
jgi:hypothetical protein